MAQSLSELTRAEKHFLNRTYEDWKRALLVKNYAEADKLHDILLDAGVVGLESRKPKWNPVFESNESRLSRIRLRKLAEERAQQQLLTHPEYADYPNAHA